MPPATPALPATVEPNWLFLGPGVLFAGVGLGLMLWLRPGTKAHDLAET